MAAFFTFFIVFHLPTHTHTFPKYLRAIIASLFHTCALSFPSITYREKNLPDKMWWHKKLHLLHNFFFSFFFFFTKKLSSFVLPICRLLRLFSLFYGCAPVAVSPCHHGNRLFSWRHILCVCACTECSAVTPRYLYSQSAPQECVWVFVSRVFSEHVWRAPNLWALEIHIVCLLFLSCRSELLLTESF